MPLSSILEMISLATSSRLQNESESHNLICYYIFVACYLKNSGFKAWPQHKPDNLAILSFRFGNLVTFFSENGVQLLFRDSGLTRTVVRWRQLYAVI